MPEGEEASGKTVWTLLPRETILDASHDTLLRWMEFSKGYEEPIPEDYQSLSESELKQWIIAKRDAASKNTPAQAENQEDKPEQSDPKEYTGIDYFIFKHYNDPWPLYTHLSDTYGLAISEVNLLPENEVLTKCHEFLESDKFKEEKEKAKQDAIKKQEEHRLASRKIIIRGDRLREDAEKAWNALENANAPPFMFIRAGELVRIDADEKGMPLIRGINLDSMRHILERAADFFKLSKRTSVNADGTKEVHFHEINARPPMELVRDMLAAPTFGLPIPSLYGIIECPTLLRDNTLVQEPGYNPATRLYYAPNGNLSVCVPDLITYTQVIDAYLLLKEIFCDFPFDGPASRENCIAALITAVIRPMIVGPTPLVIIDKPVMGTGASLIADVISLIACGRTGVTTPPIKEEEWKKTITTALATGKGVIILDNIEGKLSSAALSSVLTADVWEDRRLGFLEKITLPNRSVWIGTGNNVQFGGDMARRCYQVRMDPLEARPWQRTGFRHESLRTWVMENRSRILTAILIIARGWLQKGALSPERVPLMGSFEDWRIVVGGIMEYCGSESFLGNLETMYEAADSETAQWDLFLSVWYEVFGGHEVFLAEVNQKLEGESNSTHPDYGAPVRLFDVLPDGLADAWMKKKSFVRVLGKALAKRNGRIMPNGIMIRKGGVERNAVKWFIAPRDILPSQVTAQTTL